MKNLRMLLSILKQTNGSKILISFVFALFITAGFIQYFEPGINTYGDSLWYCFTAVSSIGFGDFTAVTGIGRVLTVYISLHAILILAIIPGIVVSYYMEIIERRKNVTVSMFLEKLEHLSQLSKKELDEISRNVKHFR
ncbi:MAG: potassium channel family protein [Anaerovoracaceae bacterium]